MSKPTFLAPLTRKGAGQCELIYAERGSVLATRVEPAFDSKARKKGLLGRESIPDDYALIIAPCSAVHTFSMRVPIDLLFVSKSGTITKTCRGVKPWRMAGSMGAYAVIETAEGFIDRHEIVPGEAVALRETTDKAQVTPAPASLLAAQPGAAHPSAVELDAPPRRHTTSRRRVTLAEVVAAKKPLGWFESVAIAQELCESVLARGPADDLRVPELKHIVLTGDGGVTLLAEGPGGHSPVQRAGLVLLALTPEEQLPMQLRLLVLEEVSPRPRLKSLGDFHRELEFFERPDRQSIVREVFERFHRQSDEASVEHAVPTPLLEPPPPKRRHNWWRRRAARVTAFAVLLVVLAAGAAWEWRRPEGSWLKARADEGWRAGYDLVRRGVDAGRQAWAAGAARLGLSSGASTPLSSSTTVGTPRSAAVASQSEPGVMLPTAEAALIPPEPAGQPVALEPPPATVVAPQPDTGQPLAAEPPTEARVYSAVDADVVPPRSIRPAPAAAANAAGVAEDPVVEIEVVVSALGTVESARLIPPGSGPRVAMMLSAVKTWTFEPATLDGEPVRYCQRMRLPSR